MPKNGEAWTVCWFKESLAKKRGCCVWGGRGVDTSIHTMYGTWKSKGIKLNTWKYDLIERLDEIIELNHRIGGSGNYIIDIMHFFKANDPTSHLESGQQKNEYYFVRNSQNFAHTMPLPNITLADHV